MNKQLNGVMILIRGAGEMATGVAHRLASCHFKVCMTETSNPQAVRREVAFSEAIFDSEKEVERVTAKRVDSPHQIHDVWKEEKIPILTDPEAVRPPVEDFAFPLTLPQLGEIRERPGEKAEIISEFAAPLGEELTSVKDTEILNLIKRRPCTTEDISKALGLRIEEVVKHLDRIRKTGTIRHPMYDHRCYYERGPTN